MRATGDIGGDIGENGDIAGFSLDTTNQPPRSGLFG
jgi:hypothetical protein